MRSTCMHPREECARDYYARPMRAEEEGRQVFYGYIIFFPFDLTHTRRRRDSFLALPIVFGPSVEVISDATC